MDTKHTKIIGGVVILAIVLLAFVYMKSAFFNDPLADEQWANTPAVKDDGAKPQKVVTAKHAYQNGKHIIVGEYNLPTPCHTLETSHVLLEGGKALINFTVKDPAAGEMCAQVITPVRFKVEISGPEALTFVAKENGEDITLNLIEAGPQENLEQFELYIKG